MGLLSDAEYYVQLEQYRDRYFEADSEEWRKYTLTLKRYRDSVNAEEVRAYESYLKELDTQRKDWLAEKKKQIDAELKLEEQRLRGILSNIDEEIAARRRLREDQSQDDAVKRAQKRLEAARHELAFARDDESRREWTEEVYRRQQELDKAIQAKDDTLFYRQKDEEKAAVQTQIEAAKTAAEQQKSAAEVQSQAMFNPVIHRPVSNEDTASELQQQVQEIARVVNMSVAEAARMVNQYMTTNNYSTSAGGVYQTNNFYNGGAGLSLWQLEDMVRSILKRR